MINQEKSDGGPAIGPQNLTEDYDALTKGIAIYPSDSALVEIQGKDRLTWLHNLTTNQVKTLQQNEGNYAFATNAKGRIQFDLVVVNRGDRLWVLVDRIFLERALSHFNKYLVTEDVQLRDRSNEFSVINLCGTKLPAPLGKLGLSQAAAMSQFSAHELNMAGEIIVAIRNDFCGPIGMQLVIPMSSADAIQMALEDAARPDSITEVSSEVIQVRRTEAGIPWPGYEITDEYLPAETRQLDRAVSFQKGCYLGQEVVERMRSRHVVARLLCGFSMENEEIPMVPSTLTASDGAVAGTLTSACRSISSGKIIGLGYARTGDSGPGSLLTAAMGDRSICCTVVPLPHVPATG